MHMEALVILIEIKKKSTDFIFYCVCVCVSVWACLCLYTHPIRETVSGEDGPGFPVCVMAKVFMHMLSQAINVMGWKLGREL